MGTSFSVGVQPSQSTQGYFIESDFDFQTQIWTSGGDVIQEVDWTDWKTAWKPWKDSGQFQFTHVSSLYRIVGILRKTLEVYR